MNEGIIIPIMNIPAGIALDYHEEEGDDLPTIAPADGVFTFPAFVREREGGGYKWIPVEIKYTGQTVTDYARLMKECYAELRRFFYGTVEQQLELQYKGKFNAHINAVRKVFPNPYKGEQRTVFFRYEVLKAFQAIPSLYESVVAAYQGNIEVQLYWNSVNDLDLENADLINMRQRLGIDDETVAQLVDIIENGAATRGFHA